MQKIIKQHIRVWIQLTTCAFSSYASNRIDSASYFVGKIIRFGFFVLMIFSIFNFTDSMAGYGPYEILLFFLTFNLIDLIGQAFMRGVYLLHTHIREGGFDYIISKPINPLFYILSRLTDLLDMIFLIPIVGLLLFTITKLSIALSALNMVTYALLVLNGLFIITGFHIIAAAITLINVENQNTIWFYRDAMSMGRFPPEIFSPTIQLIFTFVLPIFIIVAFPSKALLGTLPLHMLVFGILYSIIFFLISLLIWNSSLKKYSSASS